jgi:hypothetical protein
MDKSREFMMEQSEQPKIQSSYSPAAVKSLLFFIAALEYAFFLWYFGRSLPVLPYGLGFIFLFIFVALAHVSYTCGKKGIAEIHVSKNSLHGRWMTYVGRSLLIVILVLFFLYTITTVFLSIMGYVKPQWIKHLIGN